VVYVTCAKSQTAPSADDEPPSRKTRSTVCALSVDAQM
jgi:hypothetical protein